MEHEKIRKNFRLILIAEILLLVGLLLNAAAGGFFPSGDDETVAGLVMAGTVLGIIGEAAALVGGILRLAALIKGRDQNRYITFALFFTVLVLALTVVNSIFIAGSNTGVFSTIVDRLSGISEFVVAVCVIYAVRDLAGSAKNADLAEKAKKTSSIFMILAIIAVFSNIVTGIVAAGGVTAVIFSIVYMVLIIAVYVMYLGVLGRASKEL